MSKIFDCGNETERAQGLDMAARAARAGRLVVMPTDTVYGIGANAFDNDAVASLLAAKHRGPDMPVPVLVGSWDTARGLVQSVDDRMQTLIEAFWPGGLSIVVPQAPSLTWNLGDTRGTVMLRMPLQPVAIRYRRDGEIDLIAPFIGDDDLPSHLLRLFRAERAVVEIQLLTPIASHGQERNALARQAQRAVQLALFGEPQEQSQAA